MRISVPDLLFALSYALDAVEGELLGATTYHSKRVAYMSAVMGRTLGLDDTQIVDLTCAAVLHDNALTEYISSEAKAGNDILTDKEGFDLASHCTLGERNVSLLPFYPRVEGVILYHHEDADGTGPFGLTTAQTPLFAQIIHLADIVDVTIDLSDVTSRKYVAARQMVDGLRGRAFSATVANAFLDDFDYDRVRAMGGEDITTLLRSQMPDTTREYSPSQLEGLATIFARIIDYKSRFTSTHCQGVADKARAMAHYYQLGPDMESAVYLAGALHDIGKLVIDRDVLEKPARLTDEEYVYIQNHAWYSYQILSQVRGFEDVCRWASFHHEKLDGTGYPFGKMGYELNGLERLMGCIDIYQALVEDRPYKAGYDHAKAIGIMRSMACSNKIDGSIVSDVDERFGPRQVLVGTRPLV